MCVGGGDGSLVHRVSAAQYVGCEPIEEFGSQCSSCGKEVEKGCRIPSQRQYEQLTDWSLLCFMVATSCAHVCEVNFADFVQL